MIVMARKKVFLCHLINKRTYFVAINKETFYLTSQEICLLDCSESQVKDAL